MEGKKEKRKEKRKREKSRFFVIGKIDCASLKGDIFCGRFSSRMEDMRSFQNLFQKRE